jgi:hypothetical protein
VSGRSKIELSNTGGGFSNIDFGIRKGLGFDVSSWTTGASSTTPGFDTRASAASGWSTGASSCASTALFVVWSCCLALISF